MNIGSLRDLYSKIDGAVRDIYVVPLIRYTNKKSDYLYLLYQDLIENSDYTIHSISAFNHFKILLAAFRPNPAILHYHWLEFQDLKSILGMPWKLFCINIFQVFGGSIVWTVHNEFPHDRRFLKLHHYLHKKMAKWSSFIHVHCPTAKEIISSSYHTDANKIVVISHPEFPSEKKERTESFNKLNEKYDLKLNSDKPLFLMFGNISAYKQIDKVAEIVSHQHKEAQLLVAGPVKKGQMKLFKQLKKESTLSNHLFLLPNFIKESNVKWFYNAADCCVFNYREILSSGGIHMALSYEKKIIAPLKGCLRDLKEGNRIIFFTNQDQLTENINKVIRDFYQSEEN